MHSKAMGRLLESFKKAIQTGKQILLGWEINMSAARAGHSARSIWHGTATWHPGNAMQGGGVGKSLSLKRKMGGNMMQS